MPLTSFLARFCSLDSSWFCEDEILKWSVSVSISAVLGVWFFSYKAVRDERYDRKTHSAKAVEEGTDDRNRQEKVTTDHDLRVFDPLPSSTRTVELTKATTDEVLLSQKRENVETSRGKLFHLLLKKEHYKTPSKESAVSTSFAYSSMRTSFGDSDNNSGSNSFQRHSGAFGHESHMVAVGHITVYVASCFSLEAAFYRFPIDLKRYVHADGSKLTLVAEDLGGVEDDVTTMSYKKRCIERVQQEAMKQQTYFKVRYDIAAKNIVTTIMDRFVNINIGPFPTATASFFLVQDHMAYTIQLQTNMENYGDRLADFFPTLQRARIEKVYRIRPGKLCHALRSKVEQEVYLVYIPLQLIATRTAAGDTLALRCRHANGWSGEVVTWNPKEKSDGGNPLNDDEDGDEDVMVLIPDKLYFVSHWYLNVESCKVVTEKVRPLLAAVGASLIRGCNKVLPPSRYLSEELEMQLPPIDLFTTNVCSHLADPFVNLFVRSKDTGVFELEVGTTKVGTITDLCSLANPLFVKPPRSHNGETVAGMKKVTFFGEAENNTILRLDAVQTADMGVWYIVKSLHASENEIPGSLIQYIESILEDFSSSTCARILSVGTYLN